MDVAFRNLFLRLISTPTHHNASGTQPQVDADEASGLRSRLDESNLSTDGRDWCKKSCGSKQMAFDEHIETKSERAEQWLLKRRTKVPWFAGRQSWDAGEKECAQWLHGIKKVASSDVPLRRASTLYDVYSLFEISLIANSDIAHLGSWHNAVVPSCRVLPARECTSVLAADYHAFLTEACILQLASHFYSSTPSPLPGFIGIDHAIKMLTSMSRLEDSGARAEASSVLATTLAAYVLAENRPQGSSLSLQEIDAVIHAGEKGSLRRIGDSLNTDSVQLILDCGGLAIANIKYGRNHQKVEVTLFGDPLKPGKEMDINFVLAASLGAKKSTGRGLRLTKFTPELSLPPAEDDNFSETWGARLMALKRAFFVDGFRTNDLLELDPTAGHRAKTGGADSVVDGRVGVAWDIIAGGVVSFATLAVFFLTISFIYIGIVLHYGERVPVWSETLLSATSFLLISELSFGFSSLSRWFSREQWSTPLFLAMWVASLDFGFKQTGRIVRNSFFVFVALGLNFGIFGGSNLIYLLYFKLLGSLALSYLVCRWIVIVLVFQKSVNCAQELLKQVTIAPEAEVFDQMSKLLQDRLCGTPVLKWGFTVASELAQLEPWFESTVFEFKLHHAEAKDLGCGLVKRTDVQRIIPFDIKTVLKNLIGEDALGGDLCDLTGMWGISQVNRIRNKLVGTDGPDNLRQALRRPERRSNIGKHYKPYLLQFVSPEAQSGATQSRAAQPHTNEWNSPCSLSWSSTKDISQVEWREVFRSVETVMKAVLDEYEIFERLARLDNYKAKREALERCAINAESTIAVQKELEKLQKQVRDRAGPPNQRNSAEVLAPSGGLSDLEDQVTLLDVDGTIKMTIKEFRDFIEKWGPSETMDVISMRDNEQSAYTYINFRKFNVAMAAIRARIAAIAACICGQRKHRDDSSIGGEGTQHAQRGTGSDSDTNNASSSREQCASNAYKITLDQLSEFLKLSIRICEVSRDLALRLHRHDPLRHVVCLAKTTVRVKVLPSKGHDVPEVSGAESCIRRKDIIFKVLKKGQRLSVRGIIAGPNTFQLLIFLSIFSLAFLLCSLDLEISAPGFAVMHSMLAFVIHALSYDCVDCGHVNINHALFCRYGVLSSCKWSVAWPAVICSLSTSIVAFMALRPHIKFQDDRWFRKSRSVTLLLACIFHLSLFCFFAYYCLITKERTSDLRSRIKNVRSGKESLDPIGSPLSERQEPGKQNSVYGIALMGASLDLSCYRPHDETKDCKVSIR